MYREGSPVGGRYSWGRRPCWEWWVWFGGSAGTWGFCKVCAAGEVGEVVMVEGVRVEVLLRREVTDCVLLAGGAVYLLVVKLLVITV